MFSKKFKSLVDCGIKSLKFIVVMNNLATRKHGSEADLSRLSP